MNSNVINSLSSDAKAISWLPCLTAGRVIAWVATAVAAAAFTAMSLAAMALAAVQSNGLALENIPNALLTSEIALAAVQEYGMALQYVPKELITPEIALAAVQQMGWAVKYVPKELITPEIALEAVVQQKSWALEYVPKELITPEIALTAVQSDGDALQYVPKELITPEIALAAVRQNGRALFYVPEELITSEIAFAAVQQNVQALRWVPELCITDDLIEACFKESLSPLELQQGSAQQLDRLHIIANLPSIAPTTGPLPVTLQSFVDTHLFTGTDLTWDDLASKGFQKIASGSLKDTLIHPALEGYVCKISHDRECPKSHSSYALIQDALTMRHFQKLVADHHLAHIHIPETYLIINGNQSVIIQERVELKKTHHQTEGLSQLNTLIRLMDQTFYPLISDAVKAWPKHKVVDLTDLLVEIAAKRALPPRAQQFVERAWVWDLAPESAHNAGVMKGSDKIAILDGAL